ncbi:MAG: DUF1844 domain-containing protein [Myxococcota bacterium]
MSEESRRGPGFTVSDGGDAQPRVDFSSFCLSLGTSALYHLGMVPDPETGKSAAVNLPVARQTIDSLEMLREKTEGNLDEEEAKLLEGLLYELHLRYVEARNAESGGEG